MIYAVLKAGNNENAFIYDSMEDLNRDLFSPNVKTACILELCNIHGKTYRERKESAREKAIEYSLNVAPGLSYGELALIEGYFENVGRRYGLLKEYRENAIC